MSHKGSRHLEVTAKRGKLLDSLSLTTSTSHLRAQMCWAVPRAPSCSWTSLDVIPPFYRSWNWRPREQDCKGLLRSVLCSLFWELLDSYSSHRFTWPSPSTTVEWSSHLPKVTNLWAKQRFFKLEMGSSLVEALQDTKLGDVGNPVIYHVMQKSISPSLCFLSLILDFMVAETKPPACHSHSVVL